jgi:hypothetical protein
MVRHARGCDRPTFFCSHFCSVLARFANEKHHESSAWSSSCTTRRGEKDGKVLAVCFMNGEQSKSSKERKLEKVYVIQ